VSLPASGEPQGWNEDVEKHPMGQGSSRPAQGTAVMGGLKFDMFGADSLKVTRQKAERQQQQRSGLSSDRGMPPPVMYNQNSGRPNGPNGSGSFSRIGIGRLRGRSLWILLISIAILLIILIAVLATKMTHKKNSSSGVCTNGKIGALCNLGASLLF